MSFGLTNRTVEKINSVLAAFPAIQQAIIFGSRAKGDWRQGSDIDLSLKGDHLTPDALYSINIELDNLLLPYTIDLAVHKNISNPALVSHIERVGKTFYNR